MFKLFLQDPNPMSRTTDFVVTFTLFGWLSRPAIRKTIIVRTCSRRRALRLVRNEYRRSGDHTIVRAEPVAS